MNFKPFLVVSILMSLLLIPAISAFPAYITQQGRLVNSTTGNSVNGTYNMTFRFYTAETGGTDVWDEGQENVSVTNGIWHLTLGTNTTLDLNFTQDYWMSIQINGNSEMSPRRRITSSAYTFYANNTDLLDGKDSTEFLSINGSNITVLDANETYWIGSDSNWWGKILSNTFRGVAGIFDSINVLGSFFVYSNNTINMDANVSVSSGAVVIWSNGTVEATDSDTIYTGVDDVWVNVTGDTMTGELNVSNKIYLYPNGTIFLDGNLKVPTTVVIWSNGTVEVADSDTIYTGVADNWVNATGDYMTGELNISGKIFLYPNGTVEVNGNYRVPSGVIIWSNGTVEIGSQATYDGVADNWVNETGDTMTGNLSMSSKWLLDFRARLGWGNITEFPANCTAGYYVHGISELGLTCVPDDDNDTIYAGVADDWVNVTGDVMTGDLNITDGTNEVNISAGGVISINTSGDSPFVIYNRTELLFELNGTGGLDLNWFRSCTLKTDANGNMVCGTDNNDNTVYVGVADNWVNESGDLMTGDLNMTDGASWTNISSTGFIRMNTSGESPFIVYNRTELLFEFNNTGGLDLNWFRSCNLKTDANGNVICGVDDDTNTHYAGVADNWVNETGDTMTGNLSMSSKWILDFRARLGWGNITEFPANCTAGYYVHGISELGLTCVPDDDNDTIYAGVADNWVNVTGDVMTGDLNITGALNVTEGFYVSGDAKSGKGEVWLWSNGTLEVGASGSGYSGVNDDWVNESGDIMTGDLNITNGTSYVNMSAEGNINLTGNIFVGDSIGIGTTPLHDLDIVGDMLLTHVATASDEHGLELKIDANGIGDVKGIDLFYDTGAITTGQEEGAILINFDTSDSTGGEVAGLEILRTGNTANVYGLLTGIEINPILQLSGVFGNMDSVNNSDTDNLAEFTTKGLDIVMFSNDNDYVIIGDAVHFEEIEFILNTSASKNILPTFEFSTGIDAWTTFTPTDGTNGLENSGVILWLLDDVPAWTTGYGGEYLIKITRTRNGLPVKPIESLVQISDVTEYKWDKNGDLLIRKINATTEIKVGNTVYIYSNGTFNTNTNYSITTGEVVIWSNGTVETGTSASGYAGVADDWVNESGDTMTGNLSMSSKWILDFRARLGWGNITEFPANCTAGYYVHGISELGLTCVPDDDNDTIYAGVADNWVNVTGDTMTGDLNITGALNVSKGFYVGGDAKSGKGEVWLWANGTLEVGATGGGSYAGVADDWVNETGDVMTGDLNITDGTNEVNISAGGYININTTSEPPITINNRTELLFQINNTGGFDLNWFRSCTIKTDANGNMICGTDNNDNTVYVGVADDWVNETGDVITGDLNLTDGAAWTNISSTGSIRMNTSGDSPFVVYNRTELLFEFNSTGGLDLNWFRSCNIETDANGNVICGVDDTSGAGYAGVSDDWVNVTGDLMSGDLNITDGTDWFNVTADGNVNMTGDIYLGGGDIFFDLGNRYISWDGSFLVIRGSTVKIMSSDRTPLLIGYNELVINDAGIDYDTRIETDNDDYALFVDGETDNVGIGTPGATHKLTVEGSVNITGNISMEYNETGWIGAPAEWLGKILTNTIRSITGFFDTLNVNTLKHSSGATVLWANGTLETGAVSGGSYAGVADDWVNETGDTMTGTLSLNIISNTTAFNITRQVPNTGRNGVNVFTEPLMKLYNIMNATLYGVTTHNVSTLDIVNKVSINGSGGINSYITTDSVMKLTDYAENWAPMFAETLLLQHTLLNITMDDALAPNGALVVDQRKGVEITSSSSSNGNMFSLYQNNAGTAIYTNMSASTASYAYVLDNRSTDLVFYIGADGDIFSAGKLSVSYITDSVTVEDDIIVGGEIMGSRVAYTCGIGAPITTAQYLRGGHNGQVMTADRGWVMPRPGSVVSISGSGNADVGGAGDSIIWHVYKNGASVFETDSIDTSSVGSVKGYKTQARGIDTFVAGDVMACYYAPTSTSSVDDHFVMFEVVFDT
ncbi:MAG: hypothetical protein ABIF08_02520 [Nanoarchaeota archaeon]